jgi:membrane protease YdiL (CAAX protease family)
MSDIEQPDQSDLSQPPDLSALPPPAPLSAEPPASPDVYLPESNWSYGTSAGAILIGFVAVTIAASTILAISGARVVEDIPTNALLAVQAGATLLLLAGLSRFRGTGSWKRDFGFEISLRQSWGLAAGAVIQIAVAILLIPLVRLLGDDGPQQTIAQEAANVEGWELVGIVFFVVLVAPVVEELVYRGMLLGRLAKAMSRNRAVTISAAVFAVIHLADPTAILVVPGLFLVGVALGLLAMRAGNIGLAIFAHMGVNGFGVVLLLYADEALESVESALMSFL